MSKRYFSYDPEDGFEFHNTEEEARKRCQENFEVCQDVAVDDGWDDGWAEHICWGIVKGRVELVKSEPAPEGSKFDTIDTYEIKEG